MVCLLDTDVTSEILKARHPVVRSRAAAYLRQHAKFSISLITRYEVLRGLKAKKAKRQLVFFETWCQTHEIIALSDEIMVRAADLYASLKWSGRPIQDNDLFIAATAVCYGLDLATGNIVHFRRIPGLTLEDWTKP